MGTHSAVAEPCTPSAGSISGTNSGDIPPAFDTCTVTDQLAVSCSGLNPAGSAVDAIWSVAVGPGAHSGSIVIPTTNADDDLYVGLMSGSFSGAAPCPWEADSAGPGGSEALGPLDGLSNGPCYLLVTTFFVGSGPVNMLIPTVPIKLQKFTIE